MDEKPADRELDSHAMTYGKKSWHD